MSNLVERNTVRIEKLLLALLLTATILFTPQRATGYGVLSHEELIDVCWESDIKPALLKRFPAATEDEIKQAHAYAYGGSVVQDMGYYPFGSHEFTNYLHYVRSGDFVGWMLRDAQNVNEFAFALGALAHYVADAWGHPAVNAGVAVVYPKLRDRYGPIVTYEDNREAHLETEFSFDVVQVAKQRYLSKQYHDFIGFQVSEDLLERGFLDTYGIKADDLLKLEDLAVGTYRFAVSRVIPEMTQVAIASRKTSVPYEKNDKARQQFLYRLSRAEYENNFGSNYRRPGIFARILGFLLRHLIPRFGPFKALSFRDPTPQTEDLYFKSMNEVTTQYHRLVQRVDSGDFQFPNRNLDTGAPTRAGQYWMADEAYDDLVRRLAKDHFAHAKPDLKTSLLEYFASGPARDHLSRHKWKEVERSLAELKRVPQAD